MRRAQPLVFLPVDVPLCLLRRPARLVELQLAAHALHQAQLVIAVEDLEILRQARLLPVHFQQAVGEAVEGADPHAVGGHLQHVLDTPAHFPRGLVGKGHGEHRMGREPSARISQAMRCTSTRVLPEPAPASTSMLPLSAATASRCASLRPGENIDMGRPSPA
jgi:hypothetical protein